MQIVIDTVDAEGCCRLMIVEAIGCDGNALTVRRSGKMLDVPLSTIADWSPIDRRAHMALPIDQWITRRPELVCF